jgi:UDP-glucose 4-epimerase
VSRPFERKRILVTGGTGSLGKILLRRLLSGEMGMPDKVLVFSRDEAKQHVMRMEYQSRYATDEIIYRNSQRLLEFRIGDVRDYANVAAAVRDADVVINAAAMKQVPTCEYFPIEAVRTNVLGAENIVRAVEECGSRVRTVVGISTDKACKPVNTMGMTKALQERVFIQANMRCPETRFVCVRYGNVLASRGSVIPLFHEQIRNGGPVTITTVEMTRFLLTLDDAVDTVFAAVRYAAPGEVFVPCAPSARVVDIARALIQGRNIEIAITGIRPGEKVHELMVGDEEAFRAVRRGKYFAIRPLLPELLDDVPAEGPAISGAYSSETDVMTPADTRQLLIDEQLMLDQIEREAVEVLR